MTFPTTAVLDNTTRANEGPPPSASWANVTGAGQGLTINTNAIVGVDVSLANDARWLTSFGPNCEVWATFGAVAGNLEINLRCQNTGSRADSYSLFYDSAFGTLGLYYYNGAGSPAQLVAASQAVSAGDSIGLRAVGSSIEAFYKPAAGSWARVMGAIDANVTGAGYLFLTLYGNTSTATAFGGGNWSPVGRTVSKFARLVIGDTNNTLRELPINRIGPVGLTYPEVDLTAIQDALHGFLQGIPGFTLEIGGPFDNSAAQSIAASGAQPILSGAYDVVRRLVGLLTPRSFAILFGVQRYWTTGDLMFGISRTSVDGCIVTTFDVIQNGEAIEYTIKIAMLSGSAKPDWGTTMVT